MKKLSKAFQAVLLILCALALVVCAVELHSVAVAFRTYNRNHAELSETGSQAPADPADGLATEERPHVVEGILVYRHGSNWYFSPVGNTAQEAVYTLSDQEAVSNGELEVGQIVRVNCDGSVAEIAPPHFFKVFSIDILGTAHEEDFQKALDYFNTEVKPWHLPEE